MHLKRESVENVNQLHSIISNGDINFCARMYIRNLLLLDFNKCQADALESIILCSVSPVSRQHHQRGLK